MWKTTAQLAYSQTSTNYSQRSSLIESQAHTLNQLVEKTCKYRQPLCVAFVDYAQAFDSIETQAVITALQQQGVQYKYIKLIEMMNSKATATINLHKDRDEFPTNWGVRQGSTISPKLFNAALEEILRKISWESKGINIDGERSNHLRFADDIILIAEDGNQLEEMLNNLSTDSNKVGLKINMKKTKVMFNQFCIEKKIMLESTEIEKVDHYIYLRQQIRMDHELMDEVKRRTRAGWSAFGNSMERTMIGISKRDRKTLQLIRNETKVADIMQSIRRKKWRWAGHLARTSDNRWTKRVTEWRPWLGSTHRGRQKLKWSDELT